MIPTAVVFRLSDRYQVLGGLGRRGRLFLAQHMGAYGVSRRFAVKSIRSSGEDYPARRNVIIDEATVLSKLNHANIVTFVELFEDAEGIHLVREYISGVDLEYLYGQLQQRHQLLNVEHSCFLAMELLSAIDHIHQAKDNDGLALGAVHRGVDPTNILISDTGRVVLTGFGKSFARGRLQGPTEPGFLKSRFLYLAPELIAGERASVASDIYAVGVILFELLSGRRCFDERDMRAALQTIVSSGPPMWVLEEQGVPFALTKLIETATAVVPEMRFRSAHEMLLALTNLVRSRGLFAAPWTLKRATNPLMPQANQPLPKLLPPPALPAQPVHAQEPPTQTHPMPEALPPAPEIQVPKAATTDVPTNPELVRASPSQDEFPPLIPEPRASSTAGTDDLEMEIEIDVELASGDEPSGPKTPVTPTPTPAPLKARPASVVSLDTSDLMILETGEHERPPPYAQERYPEPELQIRIEAPVDDAAATQVSVSPFSSPQRDYPEPEIQNPPDPASTPQTRSDPPGPTRISPSKTSGRRTSTIRRLRFEKEAADLMWEGTLNEKPQDKES